MALLGLFSVCHAQADSNPAMPKGKLLRLEYSYGGMMMPVYGDFILKRSAETGESDFRFLHYNKEVFTKDVPDSVFTAASRISEEERMYEFASSYGLPPELVKPASRDQHKRRKARAYKLHQLGGCGAVGVSLTRNS